MTEFEPAKLCLLGYVPLTEWGYALPCFGSGPRPNVWYCATPSITGDRSSVISAFEPFASNEIRELPDEEAREIRLGDPWCDVFLWNGQPILGSPEELWRALEPYKGELAQRAPLSLLDLALATSHVDCRELTEQATAFLVERHGKERAQNWRDETLMREAVLLRLRRVARALEMQETFLATAKIEVFGHMFAVRVPRRLARALSRPELKSSIEAELEGFGQRIGFKFAGLKPTLDDWRRGSDAPRLVVIGVGGSGRNTVNYMIDAGLDGVEFIVADTDVENLRFARTDKRIQLGETITQGLGAGAHPEIGVQAAEASADQIRAHVRGASLVFILCGLGGGAGTGGASVIAQVARDEGIVTVCLASTPFTFEGRHRMRLAESGIAQLERCVDTFIVIPNQHLFRVADDRTTFAEAFKMADHAVYLGVRSVADLIIQEGLITLEPDSLLEVISRMGRARLGTGEASGENRAVVSAQEALADPLLEEMSLKGAKAVLISITGGQGMTLLEVDEAANVIADEIDADANVVLGAGFDLALDENIRVSILALGVRDAQEPK